MKDLQAFLYRIAHNTVIDFYRTRKAEVSLNEAINAPDEHSEKIMKDINIDQDMRKVIEALRGLPDDQAEIISLKYIEELSVKEIAQITGKKENNVRVILHRAIKILQNKLNNNN